MAAVPDPRNPISRVIIRFGDWLDALGDRYQAFLGKVLNRRRLVVIGVTVAMLASCAAIPMIGAEFIPGMDSGEIAINIQADKGNQLEETDHIVRSVEERLRTSPR